MPVCINFIMGGLLWCFCLKKKPSWVKYFAYQEGRERNNQSICPKFRPQLPAHWKLEGGVVTKAFYIKNTAWCCCNFYDQNCVCTITQIPSVAGRVYQENDLAEICHSFTATLPLVVCSWNCQTCESRAFYSSHLLKGSAQFFLQNKTVHTQPYSHAVTGNGHFIFLMHLPCSSL